MTNKQFKTKLENWGACAEAIEWLGDKTEKEALEECNRGDWLLWWFWIERNTKGYPDIRIITKAKADIARTVQHLMKYKRSIAALDACDQYYQGLIDEKELAAANANAAAYDVAYATAYATADAAAYVAAADTTAAYVAAYAADAAADATAAYVAAADATAAYVAARKNSLLESANICRKYFFVP